MHNNSLKIKTPLNYTQKFSPYLMNNTNHVHYEDQSVNAVLKNNWCWLWQTNDKFIYIYTHTNTGCVTGNGHFWKKYYSIKFWCRIYL